MIKKQLLTLCAAWFLALGMISLHLAAQTMPTTQALIQTEEPFVTHGMCFFTENQEGKQNSLHGAVTWELYDFIDQSYNASAIVHKTLLSDLLNKKIQLLPTTSFFKRLLEPLHKNLIAIKTRLTLNKHWIMQKIEGSENYVLLVPKKLLGQPWRYKEVAEPADQAIRESLQLGLRIDPSKKISATDICNTTTSTDNANDKQEFIKTVLPNIFITKKDFVTIVPSLVNADKDSKKRLEQKIILLMPRYLILLSAHGGSSDIAGFSLSEFQDLGRFCEEHIRTELLFVDSCSATSSLRSLEPQHPDYKHTMDIISAAGPDMTTSSGGARHYAAFFDESKKHSRAYFQIHENMQNLIENVAHLQLLFSKNENNLNNFFSWKKADSNAWEYVKVPNKILHMTEGVQNTDQIDINKKFIKQNQSENTIAQELLPKVIILDSLTINNPITIEKTNNDLFKIISGVPGNAIHFFEKEFHAKGYKLLDIKHAFFFELLGANKFFVIKHLVTDDFTGSLFCFNPTDAEWAVFVTKTENGSITTSSIHTKKSDTKEKSPMQLLEKIKDTLHEETFSSFLGKYGMEALDDEYLDKEIALWSSIKEKKKLYTDENLYQNDTQKALDNFQKEKIFGIQTRLLSANVSASMQEEFKSIKREIECVDDTLALLKKDA